MWSRRLARNPHESAITGFLVGGKGGLHPI